ncbi:MAG TPA: histidine kinase [Ideonella sp.]|uniref:sensor histidine kinase n=1 Tax=Ideonella sp. TaxID=1929293 RepID=UPI002BB0EC9B|nr:histidine kinase [Ideonella sp.]HSI46645.1 histidine kinase [Ideonella sp.]
MSPSFPSSQDTPAQRWQQFVAGCMRAFHAYGTWLVRISWRRFAVLSVLLLVVVHLVQSLPPFKWTFTESVVATRRPKITLPTVPPVPPVSAPDIHIVLPKPAAPASSPRRSFEFSIDEHGVRLEEKPQAASAPASAASAEQPGVDINIGDRHVHVALPADADSDEVRDAVKEAKEQVVEALEQARDAQREAVEAAAEAVRDAAQEEDGPSTRIRTVRYGEFLSDLALLWIVASAILKFTYKGRMQAEVKAAQATETAEAESLKRQVVEARMAAMQAQVEPHFLFNTLASIDHLIETDPPRASQMQKNLIALLRASMPTMRDTADASARDLGRELAVVKPYVEILKVRMEERLDARIDVPEGLLSAEFPAMMIQTLVENSIRHGLEPKPEGGTLRVTAEIVHGKLQVTVADTGVGFGAAATSGTGVGLANIRERLQLLHGSKASLTVAANQPSGTVVTITVPYRPVETPGRPL